MEVNVHLQKPVALSPAKLHLCPLGSMGLTAGLNTMEKRRVLIGIEQWFFGSQARILVSAIQAARI
jgi:hypothetical protein